MRFRRCLGAAVMVTILLCSLAMLFSLDRIPFTASIGLGSLVNAADEPPVVAVKNGSYSGIHSHEYNQDFFLGIPYAQPPTNDLRFRVPRSLNETWSSAREATQWPPFCVGYGGDNTGHALLEDCLYLNVFRPTPSSKPSSSPLPVAVWIHGGGLFMGGTNDQRYNTSFILKNSVEMKKPMLAVSIQYRLSGFGFLSGKEVLESGATNLGLRDQRLALHWIQENIAAFGGDPSKVTIWGESAGAQSVGAHFLAYGGRDDGLFRSGICQSGGPAVSYFPATLVGGYNSSYPQQLYDALVKDTSCSSSIFKSGSSLDCLRKLPFEILNAFFNTSGPPLPFVPQIDHDFITAHPSTQLSTGAFVRKPLLIGANTDEGTAFGSGFGPTGAGINNDSDFLSLLTVLGIPSSSPASQILPALYPNIQALGIPSLLTLPQPIIPESPFADLVGLQYRRVNALLGDIIIHSPQRLTVSSWSAFSVPVYSYRFDVLVPSVASFVGSTHFQEVAFVFDNVKGVGYNAESNHLYGVGTNPFGNLSPSDRQKFEGLAEFMSRSWVSFIVDGDPNGHSIKDAPVWPQSVEYGGEGMGMVWSVNVTGFGVVDGDTWRGEAIDYLGRKSLELFGV